MLAEERGVDITEVPLGDLQEISSVFDADIASVSEIAANVEQYNEPGTSSSSIQRQLLVLRELDKELRQQS